MLKTPQQAFFSQKFGALHNRILWGGGDSPNP